MSEVKKCPKCIGEMVEGSVQTLSNAFRCTRPDLKELEEHPQEYENKIQPYYCKNCGYVEFYRQTREKKGSQ